MKADRINTDINGPKGLSNLFLGAFVLSGYTISGTISGLTSSGLVLQNNGGDDLTVTAGATTFSFPIKVTGAFDVSILSVPGNPPQTCTVTGGSGDATAATPNIALSCTNSTWQAAEFGTPGALPKTAAGIDGNSNVMVVNTNGTPTDSIHFTSNTEGGGWGVNTALTNGGSPYSYSGALDFLRMKMNEAGQASITWDSVASASPNPSVIGYQNGVWNSNIADLIATDGGNQALIDIDESGNWSMGYASSSNSFSISTQPAAQSSPSFSAQGILSCASNTAGTYAMDVSPHGNIVFACNDASTPPNVKIALKLAGGSWSSQFFSGATGTIKTKISINDAGDMLIALASSSSLNAYYSKHGTGSWQHSLSLMSLVSSIVFDTALDAAGNGIVVWYGANTITPIYQICVKRFSMNNASWDSSQCTAISGTPTPRSIAMAINSKGFGYFAASDSLNNVFLESLDITAALNSPNGTPYTTGAGNTDTLSLDANEKGQGVVAWGTSGNKVHAEVLR